jgi:phosphoenolpyruvate carboxylase
MIDMATIQHMSADQAVGVMRTFSIMLNLINSAEVTHRTRTLQQYESHIEQQQQQKVEETTSTVGPLPLLEDSIRGTIDALLSSTNPQPVSPQQIYHQLLRQKVEIVLTAHPTQVQRKSLLRKYRTISETLQLRDDVSHTKGYGPIQIRDHLARIISSIWGADEIRRSKPTPQQEAAGGNAVIETVLWDAVPTYLRKLHTQCQIQLNLTLPIDCCPIKFASWIGGDRDGT